MRQSYLYCRLAGYTPVVLVIGLLGRASHADDCVIPVRCACATGAAASAAELDPRVTVEVRPDHSPRNLECSPFGFVYPDEGDGILRVLRRIGTGSYYVMYSRDQSGYPSARVTHRLVGTTFVPLSEADAIPRTTSIAQAFSDCSLFAFVFDGKAGLAYAQLLKHDIGNFYWLELPREDPADDHQTTGTSYRMLTRYETRSALCKKRADELERKLHDLRDNPQVQDRLARSTTSTAFWRFRGAYLPYLPTRPLDMETVIARTGLPRGHWGTHAIIRPKDPNRPGIVAVADEESLHAVAHVISRLRNATTATLIAGKLLRLDRKYIESTRANAIVVAKPRNKLHDGIRRASDDLAQLPDWVAAYAVLRAESMTGDGPWASAELRVERAARGGLFGGRAFNEGLDFGRGQAAELAHGVVEDVIELMAERTKQMAWDYASRIEAQASEVGKAAELLGLELDFANSRAIGVEYYVTANEGKTYLLRNVGRNFQEANGDFVPAEVYGRFNVRLLREYGKNHSISREFLYKSALVYDLFPTEEGEIVFVNAKLHPEAAMAKIRETLSTQYARKQSLSLKDIQQALTWAR